MNGKSIKNKFGEALYKNELMFEKVMNKRMDKVNEELTRYSHIFDSANIVFLNLVKQKRTKWIQEDKRYREYYKMVCTNVHKKKLNTLGQSVDPDFLPLLNDDIQYKFVLLDQHIKTKKISKVQFPSIIIPPPKVAKEVSFYEPEFKESIDVNNETINSNDETNEANNENLVNDHFTIVRATGNQFFDDEIIYTNVDDSNTAVENQSEINNLNLKPKIQSSKTSNVPKLPKIKSAIYNIPNASSIQEDFEMLYSKFSECDTEFLEQIPAKVEAMDTSLGRRLLHDKKQKGISLKRQKQKFNKIQANAVSDKRFQGLMSNLQNNKSFVN